MGSISTFCAEDSFTGLPLTGTEIGEGIETVEVEEEVDEEEEEVGVV